LRLSGELKGHYHEIFDFRFSKWISFPKPLIIPLGPFLTLRKFTEIFAAQGAPLLLLTPVIGGKWKKFAAGAVDTGGNFAGGVVDTVGAP
jgi:hypothetical protein